MKDFKKNSSKEDNALLSTQDNNVLDSLPANLVLSQIFSLLEPEELLKMSGVNHCFNRMSQDSILWRHHHQQHFLNKDPLEIDGKKTFIESYQQYARTRIEDDLEETQELAKPQTWRVKMLAACRGDIDKITQGTLADEQKDRLYALAASRGYESAYSYLKDKNKWIVLAFEWAVDEKNLSTMASLIKQFGDIINDGVINNNFVTAVRTEDPEFVKAYYKQYGAKVSDFELGAALDDAKYISDEMVNTIWELADDGKRIPESFKEATFHITTDSPAEKEYTFTSDDEPELTRTKKQKPR